MIKVFSHFQIGLNRVTFGFDRKIKSFFVLKQNKDYGVYCFFNLRSEANDYYNGLLRELSGV
jgi:hypothetical protein